MALGQIVLRPMFSFVLTAWQEDLLIWEQDVERYASAAGERLSKSMPVAILEEKKGKALSAGVPTSVQAHHNKPTLNKN